MKRILLFALIFLFVFFVGCNNHNSDVGSGGDSGSGQENPPVHECTTGHWVWDDGAPCMKASTATLICDECGEEMECDIKWLGHDLETSYIEPTCEEDGYELSVCKRCHQEFRTFVKATGHQNIGYEVITEATDTSYGTRRIVCKDCGAIFKTVKYANNGFSTHGKLSVNGPDLVDENGDKFQLIGLSTHGLQWAFQFVNLDSFAAIQEEFGINVIRLSLYPEEGGYCDCDETYKEYLYQLACKGVRLCAQLDMYAILDWHMLGTKFNEEEALKFFERFSKEFKDYDNVIYEIMNEPYGNKWADCKAYANKVIPVIRENSDGVILVGNPKYDTDLESVRKSPLDFDNIMYTYHFYANGQNNTSAVKYFYEAGMPVFISEHGGMQSTGDGPLDIPSIKNWHKVLDSMNISYVAWNISNTGGSASIVKHGSTKIYDFSDDNLKEWGQYYKKVVRTRFGLPIDEEE